MSFNKPGSVLFEVPIKSDSSVSVGGHGTVVCTQPSTGVYLLTFTNGPDNRLVTAFCRAMILALDIIEHRYEAGVVITTSSIPKFYSNGMDLEHAAFSRDYMHQSLYGLWRRLLTYPMPTIALCNGHAFAGGFMLAMMHDYRVMNPHKGYLCLNEIELGAALRAPMTAVFRMKLNGTVLRKMVLEAHRYKALEALRDGIIDHVGGLDETLAYIEEMKLVSKAQPGLTGASVYGELKREMWRETLEMIDNWAADSVRPAQMAMEIKKERATSLRKVEAWEKTKAKL